MRLKSVVPVVVAVTLLLALAFLPLLGDQGQPVATGGTTCGSAGAQEIPAILATIRTMESGGNYTAQARGSTASGAYQFLDTTWAGYGGYPRAWMAPPAVQDAKATEKVEDILTTSGGDVSAVPVVWYLGHLPPPGSREWDTVPGPLAGNQLTPRQYQSKWLSALARTATCSWRSSEARRPGASPH